MAAVLTEVSSAPFGGLSSPTLVVPSSLPFVTLSSPALAPLLSLAIGKQEREEEVLTVSHTETSLLWTYNKHHHCPEATIHSHPLNGEDNVSALCL